MRLKSILARDMADGMRRVREQLGESAIIVQTRESDTGVLITVAVEEAPVAAAAAAAPEPEAVRLSPGSLAATDAAPADAVEEIAEALERHGVPLRLSAAIAAAAEAAGEDDALAALSSVLAARFRFDPVAAGAAGRPLLLVGPAGAGKTVTVAKLAAEAVLAGQPVSVITADAERAGAVAQLETFTAALGLRLQRAADPGALARLLPAGRGLVLIDAAAANPFDAAELDGVRRTAEAGGAEPVLVLPAGLDPAESGEIAAAYARVGVRRMIATRLDAARRIGGLLAAADRGRIAFAQLSASRQVAHPLQPADAAGLARRLVNQNTMKLALSGSVDDRRARG